MSKRALVIGAVATIALIVAATTGLNSYRPASGASPPPGLSIEDLHRRVDAGALPVTEIHEPY